ncbi:hypothetical protein CLV76_10738 [Marivita geojedonensis]|nr:hypothetical protein CLV76_10738 [Marivita geojedonensis]
MTSVDPTRAQFEAGAFLTMATAPDTTGEALG